MVIFATENAPALVYSLLVSWLWSVKFKRQADVSQWAEDHIIFNLVMHRPWFLAFGALETSEQLYSSRDTFEFDQGHDWPGLNQSQCFFRWVTVLVYNTEWSSLLLLTKSYTMQKEIQNAEIHFVRSILNGP